MSKREIRCVYRVVFAVFFALMVYMLGSCSSRNVAAYKKQESVSSLQQNNIIETSKQKIKSDILRISTEFNLDLKPNNPKKPMEVVYGDDTITSTNANISIKKRTSSEKDQSESLREDKKKDQSRSELDKDTIDKGKNSERTSSSWGLNLGIIVGIVILILLLFVYYKTKS